MIRPIGGALGAFVSQIWILWFSIGLDSPLNGLAPRRTVRLDMARGDSQLRVVGLRFVRHAFLFRTISLLVEKLWTDHLAVTGNDRIQAGTLGSLRCLLFRFAFAVESVECLLGLSGLAWRGLFLGFLDTTIFVLQDF